MLNRKFSNFNSRTNHSRDVNSNLKKTIYLLLFISIIQSCSSTRTNSDIITQKLELCQKIRHEKIIFHNSDSTNLNLKRNVFEIFENYLLINNQLNGINKKSYLELFDKIAKKNIDYSITEKFNLEIPNIEYIINPAGGILEDIGCLDYIYSFLNIVDKNDFQFKFYKKLTYFTYEDWDNNDLIKEMVKAIPEKEFGKITYRKVIIRIAYLKMKR